MGSDLCQRVVRTSGDTRRKVDHPYTTTIDTTFADFNADGLPTSQKIVVTTKPDSGEPVVITYTLTQSYVGYDGWLISEVSGYSESKKGKSDVKTLQVTYDSYGNLASTEGDDQQGFRRVICDWLGNIVKKSDSKIIKEERSRL